MRVITVIKKNEYPKQLLEIPEPPEKLFVRGTLPAEETKFLCVVGSRKYTKYGEEACIKIISELRGYPIAIVSGLALGIDRLFMVIMNKSSLRELIAFPKNKDAKDLVMDAPSEVPAEQLKEVHIKVTK